MAGVRSGAVGLLNLAFHTNPIAAARACAELAQVDGGPVGLVLRGRIGKVESAALAAIVAADLVLLVPEPHDDLGQVISHVRQSARRVGVVVTSRAEAEVALAAGCDLLVAKGHESGGFVGEETSFVLVQSLLAAFDAPIYVWGGISWNTAAACAAVGCAGVILDWQLALLRESSLGAAFRRRLSAMDGSEIATLQLGPARALRFYHQPGMTARARLEALAAAADSTAEVDWATVVSTFAQEPRERQRLWLAGQDATFAADWARQATSVGRALRLLEQRVGAQVRAAHAAAALDEHGPLARSHGTQFPIVQGPMTRVSDVPEFCRDVAVNGGLPFLALALMGEAQVRTLLEETKQLMGDRSWGVGMLGFVPHEIRSQQWPVIQEVKPPFAIIAGGRPDQAASLEASGIATYLHVPSPGMLDMFLREKARRFVFEGRECGGHVGPRTSFVLWESMIRVLCEAGLSDAEAAQVHVLFAGGIHDAVGAAMVSVLAQPLVERGMKVGVLLGTAYLFTHEIVKSGAVVEGFQSMALAADHTVIVESGPGHAIRCAPNDYVDLFEREKRRLAAEQRPAEEQRGELEMLNLGRLRIAAKGVTRGEDRGKIVQVKDPEQRRDGMYMIGQVAALRGQPCSIRELHEEVCHGAKQLLARAATVELLTAADEPRARPLDIAIVGMACLLPGATDPGELWQKLLAKHDPIVKIPEDRFEVDRWFDTDRKARDKVYGQWGGFVDDLPFDPLKFGIPPASIPSIEPMQLLAMELVDRALADAGYAKQNPHREKTSIILGIGGGAGELGSNYAFRAMLPRFLENPDESLWEQLPEWTEDSFAGILFNVVAGRISNRFDFGGVNCTVDAACASSLGALYWACNELASGRSDMAITGGCDTMQNPFGYLCFAKAGALSPRGKARVFDADSDGIVISEGHAALVLKRREDAERDGDKIYAVIRAVAGGSDGRSKGLTAPRVEGQIRTLERAYEQAGVNPAEVQLFEAHGTGTAVGDQTEGFALTTLLKQAGAAPQSVAVGSIKSMIGHTKCAAGAVGLIKAVLAMQHRVLPPTMHVERPNPKAGLVDGPLYVNSEARPWLATDKPRRAGVSSFGFGGTNFHVLLEEYDRAPSARPVVAQRDRQQELFALGADSPAALKAAALSLAGEAAAVAASGLPAVFARLAYTHHLRTSQLDKPHRAVFVAESLSELEAALRAFAESLDEQGELSGKLPAGAFYTSRPQSGGQVAFLFPGQGSQHPGMLQELAIEYPEVAACFQRADDELFPVLGDRLSRFIFPPPAFSDAERAQASEDLKATRIAQPALGVCGQAMLNLLRSFGVHAAMSGGHSFGELVALSAAGAISEIELMQLAAARGRVMTATADTPAGAMLAVSAGPAEVEQQLQGLPEVWIANLNGRSQTVLSGTQAGIAAALNQLNAAGIGARQLPVAAAFHSPFMAAPRDAFRQVLEQIEFAPPASPVYGNVEAQAYSGAPEEFRTLLAEQLTSKVRFVEQIEAMYRDGARVFVELGPKGVLTGLVRDILRDRPHVAIATQPSGDKPARLFLHALAQLAIHGVEISFERLYDHRDLEPLDRATLAGRPAAPLSPHLWLVNGAYSRKVGEPRRSTAPRARLAGNEPIPVLPAPSAGHILSVEEVVSTPPPVNVSDSFQPSAPQREQPMSAATHQPAVSAQANGHSAAPLAPTTPTAAPAAAAGAGMNAGDYATFQETMRMFLSTQEAVLKNLFGQPNAAAAHRFDQASAPAPHFQPVAQSAAGSPAPPVVEAVAPVQPPQEERAVPPEQPVAAPLAVAASIAPAEPAAIAEPASPAVGLTYDQLAAQLTGVVADRTGYPAEMLSLDINLESELGIDSIKRVEIIAAFRRLVLPEMQEPPAEFMERLASAKSMGRIVEVVAEIAGSGKLATAAANTAAEPVAAPASGPLDPDDLLVTLLRIVADRTGYPAEMLDLDINLESELGIDSIKRVEIIAAFRREVLPELQEPPAEFMERLSSAKTMRAIIDVMTQMSGAASGKTEAAAELLPAAATAAGNSLAAAPTMADAKQLHETLLRIVADRTGYPPEMLDLEINLESELGIDSIKRVEIIAAFRREVRPDMLEPPAELMERLTSAKTMQAIIGCFASPATTAPIAKGAHQNDVSNGKVAADANGAATEKAVPYKVVQPADHAAAEAGAECPRCVIELVETPIVHRSELSAGVIVLTTDNRGVADRWAGALRAAGKRVAQLTREQLTDRDTTRRAIAHIRSQHGPIAAVAHLLPLDECPAWPGISAAAWTDRMAIDVKGLLYLVQAIEPELAGSQHGAVRVLCASIGGGDFSDHQSHLDDNNQEAAHPWRAGLAGLLKVAACEWPQHSFRAVDLLSTPDVSLLDDELRATGPVEIGYRGNRRLAVHVRRAELATPSREAIERALSADSVILVTGGAKGITAQIVAEIARQAPAKFVLLGRSPWPQGAESAATAHLETDAQLRPAIIAQFRAAGETCTPARVEAELGRIKSDREIRRNLAEITAHGARVEYVCCDARDQQSLTKAIAAVQTRYGQIHALIHGAGIIDDRAIKDKTSDSFDRVVGTKVDPLLTMATQLDTAALKLVVLFGSTSGIFGNSGQGDYAVANEILNRLARRWRTRCAGKIVTLNWGPWAGAGMVTPEVAEKMRSKGVDLISLAGGRGAAWREMIVGGDEPRVVLGHGPWLEAERLRTGKLDFSKLGPLLNGHLVESRDDGQVTVRVKLDPSMRYLQDHCIEGKAILPVAVAVGLMAETAHRARPDWHVASVENVRMLSGIAVEAGGREILISAEPLAGESTGDLWKVKIAAADFPARSLYDAQVRLTAALPAAPKRNAPDRIAAPLAASASEAYDRWLFHGPAYQVIQGFTGADESGIDAVVRGGCTRSIGGTDAPWILDPVVVDAAPQLAMIWSRALYDVAVLPSRISSYRVYEPIGGEDVEMMLRVRPGTDRQVYQADVWIVREGRIIAHMEGLEGAGSAQLNRIAASGAL